MSLAKLQVSLRTDLCHLAAAAMTVSPLPWLFFTSWMLFLPPNQQRQCSEGHICPLQRETDTTQWWMWLDVKWLTITTVTGITDGLGHNDGVINSAVRVDAETTENVVKYLLLHHKNAPCYFSSQHNVAKYFLQYVTHSSTTAISFHHAMLSWNGICYGPLSV